jgi:hypothetical protein
MRHRMARSGPNSARRNPCVAPHSEYIGDVDDHARGRRGRTYRPRVVIAESRSARLSLESVGVLNPRSKAEAIIDSQLRMPPLWSLRTALTCSGSEDCSAAVAPSTCHANGAESRQLPVHRASAHLAHPAHLARFAHVVLFANGPPARAVSRILRSRASRSLR